MTKAEYLAAERRIRSTYDEPIFQANLEVDRVLTRAGLDWNRTSTEKSLAYLKVHSELLQKRSQAKDPEAYFEVEVAMAELELLHEQDKARHQYQYKLTVAQAKRDRDLLVRRLKAEMQRELDELLQAYEAAMDARKAQPLPTFRSLLLRLHPDKLSGQGRHDLIPTCAELVKDLTQAQTNNTLTPTLIERVAQQAAKLGL